MELDEFKQLYKEKETTSTASHSVAELEAYMRIKTHSITGKIKRSIVFEFAVSILFIVAAVWVWMYFSGSLFRPFAMLTIALCCIFFLYLGALYKKVIRYEQSPPAVKNSLREMITILQQFTRLYFQFTMVSMPILFVFGLIALYLNVSGNPAIKNFNWLRGLIFYGAGFALWWTAVYFFAKWYINKLYGNYLSQLQQQLKDIENG